MYLAFLPLALMSLSFRVVLMVIPAAAAAAEGSGSWRLHWPIPLCFCSREAYVDSRLDSRPYTGRLHCTAALQPGAIRIQLQGSSRTRCCRWTRSVLG
ncbi:hypothetical protein BDW74DRAFT_154890 [Aspergillus multicolor]|uniref:uncharacterized protein n=1 Tax=Aspergillus multicolor TaxID=41759 RepID=UPI003CCC9915